MPSSRYVGKPKLRWDINRDYEVEAETVAAEFDEADYLTHRLRTPLDRNGERILRVRMRPATLGDIDDWSSGELSNRDLLVRLSGLSAATIKALAWEDAEAIMALFQQMVPDFILAVPGGKA